MVIYHNIAIFFLASSPFPNGSFPPILIFSSLASEPDDGGERRRGHQARGDAPHVPRLQRGAQDHRRRVNGHDQHADPGTSPGRWLAATSNVRDFRLLSEGSTTQIWYRQPLGQSDCEKLLPKWLQESLNRKGPVFIPSKCIEVPSQFSLFWNYWFWYSMEWNEAFEFLKWATNRTTISEHPVIKKDNG